MNLEEFKKTYNFAENMNEKNIKELVLFIFLGLMEMSLGTKKEESKISQFIIDSFEIAKKG